MTKVAYRVTSPLKRDGKIIPVGGSVVFDGDDEEQVELADLGAIDGASGILVDDEPKPTSPPPPPNLPKGKGKGDGPATGKGDVKADGAGATGGAS